MARDKTRDHADRFREQLMKLLEDHAASMHALGITPTRNVARHEVADAAAWMSSEFAELISETLTDREVALINRRVEEQQRREAIRNDPNIN